jgi:hypothetical protein
MTKSQAAKDAPLVPLSSLKRAVKHVLTVSKQQSDADLEVFQLENIKRKAAKKKG